MSTERLTQEYRQELRSQQPKTGKGPDVPCEGVDKPVQPHNETLVSNEEGKATPHAPSPCSLLHLLSERNLLREPIPQKSAYLKTSLGNRSMEDKSEPQLSEEEARGRGGRQAGKGMRVAVILHILLGVWLTQVYASDEIQ